MSHHHRTDARGLGTTRRAGTWAGMACAAVVGFACTEHAAGALLELEPAEAAMVQKGTSSPGGTASDVVRVKNAGTDQRTRKSWLKYDIAALDFEAASGSSVEFELTSFNNTNRDGNTFEFELFGMTDEGLDDWTSATITWDNAPGNDMQDGREASGPGVDPALTTSLGTFSVVQDGTGNHGSFTISGQALADFINGATNDELTMILISNSDEGAPGPEIDFDSSPTLTVIPEPASLALLGAGGLLLLRRRAHDRR